MPEEDKRTAACGGEGISNNVSGLLEIQTGVEVRACGAPGDVGISSASNANHEKRKDLLDAMTIART